MALFLLVQLSIATPETALNYNCLESEFGYFRRTLRRIFAGVNSAIINSVLLLFSSRVMHATIGMHLLVFSDAPSLNPFKTAVPFSETITTWN